jgi:hypothetical protein
MNSIRKNDVLFGEQKEMSIKNVINEAFKCNVAKLPPYHPYDFKDLSSNTYFEHKGRRNAYNKYPTTMIGKNKIDFIKQNPNNQYYFIFGFTDGNYFIQYSDDVFKAFETKNGGRIDRERPEIKAYVYIPIEELTKMN